MNTMRSMIVMAAALLSTAAHAQYTDGIVKIGILTDMSGVYSDFGGLGSVAAAKLAVHDSGVAKRGMRVEIIRPTNSTSLTSAPTLPICGLMSTRSM
jgi:branched-chain amino acid transport system substrate-binding protein